MAGRPTRTSIKERARDDLFAPLGISDMEWRHYPNGEVAAASGLRLRPRDLAKIGQMVLDLGTWRSRRIVSASWIEQSSSPQIHGEGLFFYGFQWWIGRSFFRGREINWFQGAGYGGQALIIVPSLGIVPVVTTGRYHNQPPYNVNILILNRYILPAVLD